MVRRSTDAASGSAAYEQLPALLQRVLGEQVCVSLSPAQCPNLATGLASFVAESIAQLAEHWEGQDLAHWALADLDARRAALAALCEEHDPSDLDLLDRYAAQTGQRQAPIVLLVCSPERFAAAPLNDVLQAVLSWSRVAEHVELRVAFLYTAALPVLPRARMPSDLHTPTLWLSTTCTPRVLQLMDIASCVFPDKTAFWERVVCPFFLRPTSGLWLGRSVFELVRRRFWHVEPSWESVAQVVRLAYLHHFSTQPLSAWVKRIPTLDHLERHWTDEMTAAMRLAMVAPCMAQGGTLPPNLKDTLRSPQNMLDALPRLHTELATAAALRIVMLAIVQSLLEHTHMSDMQGTRLSYSACIATALELPVPYTDFSMGREPAYVLTPTTPSSAQLRALLEHLAGTVPASETEALTHTLDAQLASYTPALDADAAQVVEDARHELRRLTSKKATRTLAQYIAQTWAQMQDAAPTGLGAAIWTYDFAEPLSCALEGAARAGILLALDAPSETLATMRAAANVASGQRLADGDGDWPEKLMGISDVDELRATLAETRGAEIPDVCRLYSLYKDSGKFINLADWLDAFVQSLEGDARQQHTELHLDARAVQVRFALAINELAYMGLLGPTGRKVEHLCRTVWDLPVDGAPE